MFNTAQVLMRLDLPNNATSAVVYMGDLIRRAKDTCQASTDMIFKITGLTRKFTDEHVALMTAQALVELMIKSGDDFDPSLGLMAAELRANKFRNNPANSFLFVRGEKIAAMTVTKEVGGVTVEVKANGKVKKGGKQDSSYGLYVEHVINGGMESKDFLLVLQKELDMGVPGSRTYMYAAAKRYKETNKE